MRIELSANKLTRVLLLYNMSWKFYYFGSAGEPREKESGEYCREGITALIAVDAIDSDGY